MFLKKYKNLRTFRPYYKKYTKLILCLLLVMLIASSAGIIIGFLMSEQLLAITDMLIPQIVTYTLYILLCVTIHHTYWFLWVLIQSKLSNKIFSLVVDRSTYTIEKQQKDENIFNFPN